MMIWLWPGFDEWLTGKPHRNHGDDSMADGWMIP